MFLGVKGSEVISPPQLEHCQLPDTFGRSLTLTASGGKASRGSGSDAISASKGMSGASEAVGVFGEGFATMPFCLL